MPEHWKARNAAVALEYERAAITRSTVIPKGSRGSSPSKRISKAGFTGFSLQLHFLGSLFPQWDLAQCHWAEKLFFLRCWKPLNWSCLTHLKSLEVCFHHINRAEQRLTRSSFWPAAVQVYVKSAVPFSTGLHWAVLMCWAGSVLALVSPLKLVAQHGRTQLVLLLLSSKVVRSCSGEICSCFLREIKKYYVYAIFVIDLKTKQTSKQAYFQYSHRKLHLDQFQSVMCWDTEGLIIS